MDEEGPPAIQYVELTQVEPEPAEIWVVGENSQSSEENQVNGEMGQPIEMDPTTDSLQFPASGVCEVIGSNDAEQEEDAETHVVFQGTGAGKEEIVVKIFPVVGAYEEIPCMETAGDEVDVSCQEVAEDLESENGAEVPTEVITHHELFHHYAKIEAKSEPDVRLSQDETEGALQQRDSELKPRYSCDYCNAVFSRAGDLKDHLATHMKHESSEVEVSMDTEESDIPSDSQTNKTALSNMFEKTAARLRKHLEMQEENQLTVVGLDALSRQADVMEPLLTSTENAAVLATKPHVCGICYKAYAKASKLRKHLLTHNESYQTPTNSTLDARAKLKRLLENDQDLGHVQDQSTKTYLCGICFQAFNKEARLNKHLKTHKTESQSGNDAGEESIEEAEEEEEAVATPAKRKRRSRSSKRATKKPYKCEFCSEAFNKVSKLKKHLKIHEEQESESPAEEEDSGDEDTVMTPRRRSGGNKSPKSTGHIPKLYEYECQVCDRTFDRPCNLKYHLYSHEETKHLGVPPPQHVCDICHKTFTRPYFLRKHLLETHQIDREAPPPRSTSKKSGRKSTSSSRLVASALSPRKKTLRCEICDKAFDRPCNLKYHLYSHKETRHMGVPPPVHMCGTCGKEFNRPVLLRHHERYCKLEF